MSLEMREREAQEIYEKLVGQKLNKENAMLLAASMTIMAGAEVGEILQMKGMGMNQGMGMGQGMQHGNYNGGRRDEFYRGRDDSGQFTSRPGRGGQAGRNMGGRQGNYDGGMGNYGGYYNGQGGGQMGGQQGSNYNGMMDEDYERRMERERMEREQGRY